MFDRIYAAIKALRGDSSGGQQITLAGSSGTSWMPRDARSVLYAYNTSPNFKAVVMRIAQAVSGLEWYVRVNGERVETHPALEFFCRGQMYMSVMAREEFLQASYDLTGEAVAIIGMSGNSGRGSPVRMYALPSTWISRIPDATNDTFLFTPDNGAPAMTVPREQVFYQKQVDILQPYGRGSGMGTALIDEIRVDEYAAQHMAAVLQNHARPDMVISGTEQASLNADQAEQITARLLQTTGPNRAGRPLVLAMPVKVETLSQPFKDLALKDMREFEAAVMTSVYGVPPEIMGRLQNSNRATIDAADFLFNSGVVDTRARLRRDALNHQIAPLFGDGVEFDYVSPVEEDREFLLSVMKSRPEAFTDDEWRAVAGADELPGGLGRVLRRSPILVDVPVPGETQEVTAAAPQLIAIKMPTDGDVEGAMGPLDDTTGIEAAFRASVTEIVAEFGARAAEDFALSISFDVQDPRVIQFIEEQSSRKITQINETTKERVRKTLSEGTRNGETFDALVSRIMAEIDGATKSRGKTIARTETVAASNSATKQALTQAGILLNQWNITTEVGVGTEPGEVRPSHGALDGQTAPVDGVFTIPVGAPGAGLTASYPGAFGVAEQDINCRCFITPVIPMPDEVREAMTDSTERARNAHERRFETLMVTEISRQLMRVADNLRGRQ